MGNDIGSVSGHIYDLQIRAEGFNMAGQFLAVHGRHNHICDEKIEALFVFPGPGYGLLRVLGTDHLVAQILKDMLADFKDGGFLSDMITNMCIPISGII